MTPVEVLEFISIAETKYDYTPPCITMSQADVEELRASLPPYVEGIDGGYFGDLWGVAIYQDGDA